MTKPSPGTAAAWRWAGGKRRRFTLVSGWGRASSGPVTGRRGAGSCGEPGASVTGALEPLAVLAEHYREQGLWQLAWEACELAFSHTGAKPNGGVVGTVDALFVDTAAIQWRVAYEASIAAWYVGQVERGRRLVGYVLSRPDLPDALREAVESNRRFYEPNR